jgi:hypothetical protein
MTPGGIVTVLIYRQYLLIAPSYNTEHVWAAPLCGVTAEFHELVSGWVTTNGRPRVRFFAFFFCFFCSFLLLGECKINRASARFSTIDGFLMLLVWVRSGKRWDNTYEHLQGQKVRMERGRGEKANCGHLQGHY